MGGAQLNGTNNQVVPTAKSMQSLLARKDKELPVSEQGYIILHTG